MARGRKSKGVSNEANPLDYRYPREKRTNIPPGRIAGEGIIPKVPKVRYSYSPHLPPTLQFDATGGPDKLNDLVEKAKRVPLSAAEAGQLRDALKLHEPWLEWSGKREKPWFDVDPVALHMHERISAQAILRVAAREDVQRYLFADPQQNYAQAVQFYKHDVDWANRVILGDSLQVMASLARREGLAGKVQMIYLDPPYGIKFRSNFQSEVGKREISDKETDLTREPETVKAYRDTWTLGTHSYLTYLRDRLRVACDLLTESGSLFLQISDENQHLIRNLLDEVFGRECQVATIAYKKAAPDTTTIKKGFNYLLWYCKNRDLLKVRQLYRERRIGEGTTEDPKKLALWLQTPTGFKRTLSAEEKREEVPLPADAAVFRADKVRDSGDLEHKVFAFAFEGEHLLPGAGFGWRGDPDEMRRLREADRLVRTDETLAFKMFMSDSGGVELTSLWEDTAGKIPDMRYVVQTNEKVVARCILLTTDPGDLVFDPTCGSGTTAYVAEQWGRRWITVDTSRVSIAIARQRLLTAKFDAFRFRPLNQTDLKRNPNGFWLNDPMGSVSSPCTFQYKQTPHLKLKSIAKNANLDPIFAKHQSILDDLLVACNAAVAKVSDDLRRRLTAKLTTKQKADGNKSITDADRRRLDLPKKWEHWRVPFDTDEEWPKDLQIAVIEYRQAWRAKMDEVTSCIEANADLEELVDQPVKISGIVRVSGPFTVEGVRPEELNLGDDGLFDGSPNEREDEEGANLAATHQQNLQAYLNQMAHLIRQDGLTFLNNKLRRFIQVDSLFDASTGAVLHAEGSWEGSPSPEVLDVAIGFGPQYGPVTAQQVEELIHASKRHSELVVAGFSFDADATALIQEQSHPKLRIHQVYIRPDVNPGMAGLLKETPNSQLFTVFGTPEIEIKSHDEGTWVVHLKGVEVYDPVANTINSTGADKVAAWFLDGDFDGRCFCITQAFFPNQDSWEKIAKALGSAADADAFEAFKGTTSIPFPAGKYTRVAVKVIDPRGNEVMAVRALEA
jgi:adenine-specific DNA-methyltransferase